MVIWRELMLSDEKKALFNKQIGNIKELYDPKNGPGMVGNYPNITNSSTPTIQSQGWTSHDSKVITFANKTSNTIPSIKGRRIRVPLMFFLFCNDPGLALPLIALQYSIVGFELGNESF